MGAEKFQVSGESWFDHEWATNQLAPNQVGWDWLSLHLNDGTELMLYRMRLADGTADPTSSGTFVAADGVTTHLDSAAFQMSPTGFWKSEKTGANYPTGWRVEIPGMELQLTVHAALENQELALLPLAYWEGAVEVTRNARRAARSRAAAIWNSPATRGRCRNCSADENLRLRVAGVLHVRALRQQDACDRVDAGERGRRGRLSCSCGRENHADSSGCASSAVACVS